MIGDKNKTVMCDVCGKQITTKEWKWLLIHNVDKEDRLVQQASSNNEIEMDICNECILHLNFREYKKATDGDQN